MVVDGPCANLKIYGMGFELLRERYGSSSHSQVSFLVQKTPLSQKYLEIVTAALGQDNLQIT